MEPTPSPTPIFSPEEEKVIVILMSVLGTISFFSSLFVILTFLIFPEKRKFPAWSLNVSFVFSVWGIDFLLLVGVMLGFDSVPDHNPTGYCLAQGILMVFLGCCMMWFWFFITLNLFLKMVLNKDSKNVTFVILGFLFSGIMTIPPSVKRAFSFDGAWCFISNDEPELLYGGFYGWMGFLSLIGLVMWVAIMYKIYKSQQAISKIVTPFKSQDEIRLQNIQEKKQLFMRQLAFVTVYEITFIIFFTARIHIQITGSNEFALFVFHTILMSSLGLYSFFIFGLKRQNFTLWASLCQSTETKMQSIRGSMSPFDRAGYQRIS